MVLGTGDVVPADLRLFEAKDFKVSEMALTGAGHRKKGWTFEASQRLYIIYIYNIGFYRITILYIYRITILDI